MVVVGTAGHVDHGKTTLVYALTGIYTDRLKDEQERGITTELGFAHLDMPDGTRVSIVDAPGHERFVRHMIAGAGGLDAVVLVVAADEGVKPQTREHLDILSLVGVKKGFVVLTKCDITAAETMGRTIAQVRSFLDGSFLSDAPVLLFHGGRPETFEAFKCKVQEVIRTLYPSPPERPDDRPFKMAIDRVFVMSGFGTVVTGTVTAGSISVGESIEVLPNRLRARVRGIQSHGTAINSARAGTRAALNLHGVDHSKIARGHVIAAPGAVPVSSVLDVTFRLLPVCRKPLHRRTPVTVHIGTDHGDGVVALLDRETLTPGGEAIAQLRLKRPVAALAQDPFVVRGFECNPGHGRTIGGGRVLFPEASVRRGKDAIAALVAIRDGDDATRVEACVSLVPRLGVSTTKLPSISPFGERRLSHIVPALVSDGRLFRYKKDGENYLVTAAEFESISTTVLDTIKAMHARASGLHGFAVDEIETQLRPRPDAALLSMVLERLIERSFIRETPDGYSLAGHLSGLERVAENAMHRVEAMLIKGGLAPPSVESIADALSMTKTEVRDAILALCRIGRAVRIGDMFFASTALCEFEQRLVDFLRSKGVITIADFKLLAGVSRKYAIPLAEHFDSKKVTYRMHDGTRRLRNR